MLKPKLQNILLFIFIKYLVFYIFLMFKNSNYALISVGNLKKFQDLFYYLIIFLTLPIVFSIVLLFPIYYLLKIRNAYGFILSMVGVLILEYFLYTFLASQANRNANKKTRIFRCHENERTEKKQKSFLPIQGTET